MSLYVICYALITLQKEIQENENPNCIVLKCIFFTLHTIRVRHSAAACTRLDKYMILTVGLVRHLTVVVYKV